MRLLMAWSSAVGALLAAATRAVAAVRGAHKPLHPRGTTRTGRLERVGSPTASGVAWLDEPGVDDVVVRLSAALGVPSPLPDVHGLAVRVKDPHGPADLLLASTGWGRLPRFVLTFSRDPEKWPLTTLLPYRTASGPLVLGARPCGGGTYDLFWARFDGPWHQFGGLSVGGPVPEHPSFDPVVNQVPGLQQYAAVVRLREPAYARARRSRIDRAPAGPGMTAVRSTTSPTSW